MGALMSLEALTNNLHALRQFHDNVESHIRGLKSLSVAPETYGALLSLVVIKKLPHEIKMIISRGVVNCQSELNLILEALLTEIEARERVAVVLRDPPNQKGVRETSLLAPPSI